MLTCCWRNVALLSFLNSTYLLVSDRIVTLDAVVKDGQDDEIGADTGPQEEITGILLSPTLDNGEPSCFRLVHQITWSGRLEVLQRTEGKSFDRPLWSSQEPSDGWVTSSIDLQNNTEPYKVRKPKINKRPSCWSKLLFKLSMFILLSYIPMPLLGIWKLVGTSLITENKKCRVHQMGTMNINSNPNVNITFFIRNQNTSKKIKCNWS